MGKKSKKPTVGVSKVANSKSDTLASFDEQALSALTEKIEKEFGKTKSAKALPETTKSEGKEDKPSRKSKNERKDKGAEGKGNASELTPGTKRDAHGNAKRAGKSAAKSQKGPEKKHNGGDKDARAVLLEEILALGGTEEDLDLVGDVASEEEEEDSNAAKSSDKSFQKDFAKFVAGLGIEGNMAEDDADSEAEEPADDGEWEGAPDLVEQESESEEIAQVPAKKAKLSITEAQSSSNPNRLVSIISD